MSVNDLVDSLEGAAHFALVTAKAVHVCPRHSGVTLRVGDPEAERHAYALATTIAKRDGTYWMREELMEAIKDELDMAADEGCPECQRYRDA